MLEGWGLGIQDSLFYLRRKYFCRLLHRGMGGCQNDGPFLDPYYSTAPAI